MSPRSTDLDTTMITTIREAGTSWHHGGSNKVPLISYDTHDNMVPMGLWGALKIVPQFAERRKLMADEKIPFRLKKIGLIILKH